MAVDVGFGEGVKVGISVGVPVTVVVSVKVAVEGGERESVGVGVWVEGMIVGV